jgi:hypothetical protein
MYVFPRIPNPSKSLPDKLMTSLAFAVSVSRLGVASSRQAILRRVLDDVKSEGVRYRVLGGVAAL